MSRCIFNMYLLTPVNVVCDIPGNECVCVYGNEFSKGEVCVCINASWKCIYVFQSSALDATEPETCLDSLVSLIN